VAEQPGQRAGTSPDECERGGGRRHDKLTIRLRCRLPRKWRGSGRLVAEPPASARALVGGSASPIVERKAHGVRQLEQPEPLTLTVQRDAWPVLCSNLLRRSFALSGDQTGVKKSAPLTGGVTCLSPLPSG
jgi:hypothetical protein